MAIPASRIPQGAYLVYFVDPMCSWCWGFAPSIRAIIARWGSTLPIRLVLGGLLPGTTQALSEEQMMSTRNHWDSVAKLSGQPFNFAFTDHKGFIFDTEPACRAVVTMLFDYPDKGLALLEHIQNTFYARNTDVSDPETLAALAGACGVSAIDFRAKFESREMRAETRLHFDIAKGSGVRDFPALFGGTDPSMPYRPIIHGFVGPEKTVETVQAWLETLHQAQPLHS
ncbi:MAG: DsbA family protein [Bosea sp. (in: a-proteobacteria)]